VLSGQGELHEFVTEHCLSTHALSHILFTSCSTESGTFVCWNSPVGKDMQLGRRTALAAVAWAKSGARSGQLWQGITTTCSCADAPEPPGGTSDGERLLHYWQNRLGRSAGGEQAGALWDGAHAQAFSSSDVRELLATAMRLRQGRVAGVLPEQVASLGTLAAVPLAFQA